MKRLALWQRTALVTLAVAALLGAVQASGWGLRFLWGAAAVILLFTGYTPLGSWALERLEMLARHFIWRQEQGSHHEFGGVTLHIEDDGRQMWVAGDDLKLVLRSADSDEVLAARHADQLLATRRDAQGRLWIRVDAVVQRLAQAPGRMDPRVVRLRRYLERDVLFPAAERRRRG